VPLYLVRHAHAGSRSGWHGSDDRRPLSPKGRHQAIGLLDLVDGVELDRVASSPAARCVETVEPIARAAGLTVEADARLGEGADVGACIEMILTADGQNLVLCSHGDLIPKVIRRLRTDGMASSDPNVSQKGSVWVLDVADGQVMSGRYHPPTRN
jgi:phosphohistidine phosphatase SixA